MTNHVSCCGWHRLAIGTILTIVVALTPHAIVTSTAILPYPISYPRTGSAALAEWVPIAAGTFWLEDALRRRFPKQSAGMRLLIACLLLLMVKETLLRRPLMSGWTSTAWAYSAIDNFRFVIPVIFCAAMATATSRLSRVWRIATIWLAGTIVAFFLQQWADVLISCSAETMGLTPHEPVYPFPYGWEVQLPSYLTFWEPVLGAIAIFAIVVSRQPPDRRNDYLTAIALITLVRGKLLLPITNMSYQQEGVFAGFVAEGQFVVEGLLVALGAALTWKWASQDRGELQLRAK